MIDRVTAKRGGRLYEVPVGFKWFVDRLLDGSPAFGGEESAGASFARLDGTVWTTDEDGIVPALLAAEITLSAKLSIYAESFRGADHLRRILEEAQTIVSETLAVPCGTGRGGAS